MIYGLYLSATGVLANSYHIDVLSNNLANAETVGFKRDLALFRERLTQNQESHHSQDWSDPILEKIGGGLAVNPNLIDQQQGELEQTGNALDVAIQGNGYFAIKSGTGTHLTRDGKFLLNEKGELTSADSKGAQVLDDKQQPIVLKPGTAITIGTDGTVQQNGQSVAKLGYFDVPDPSQLKKSGMNLLEYPELGQLRPGTGRLQSEFVERANVDPSSELAQLMESQRQLEANANMLRYQDETLQSLVNTVGKAS